ncbi:MAG: HAMP domain-containing histidine kinase [Candidatus Eremiobacteraeota bacterium]|nr:HAMP domain-containing histidine kinase [Candidatus Eremiobacteraeota bacterium]MBV8365681.1 HAMP domain-containing histidine kinase [Candidatus Eremiobacteraeota bacterium]
MTQWRELPAGLRSPRIRLALTIAGILFLLLVAFSVVVYLLVSREVLQDVEPFRDDPLFVEAAHRQLAAYGMQLVFANIVGVVLIGIASYFVAQAALRPLEQAIALQRQFTNDASHDLRTPLAVIRMETSAALHSRTPMPPDIAECLRIIDEQTQRMDRLIEQLLTLAHVDADSALNREPTDLRHLVSGVVRDLRPLADAKEIALSVARSDPALVLGDELKLSQLVANLVDNAIKYSPNSASVSVSVWQQRDAAFIAVSDTGEGIRAGDRENVFRRFHRVDSVRSPNGRGGHGLGLPLCRWIARAHGGDVFVDSREGEGSTFTVRLPALTA